MPLTKLRSAKEDALNPVEVDMLLNACRDLLDNLVVRLPLYAGLRIGEVQHLKKSWLDWDKGIITLPARQQCSCYECRKWRQGYQVHSVTSRGRNAESPNTMLPPL